MTRKPNRRKKQARENQTRAQLTPGTHNLETPEAALTRAILSRALIPSRSRIDKRANEARLFEQWRVNPSRPDPASSIAADDRDYFSESITENVTDTPVLSHALFPAMSAAENLTTVVNMIDAWDRNGKLRTMSLVTLLRSSLESASRTVWMLAPEDRNERRARALRVTKSEVLAQKKYLDEQLKLIDSGRMTATAEVRSNFTNSLEGAKAILDELEGVKAALLNEQVIGRAAEWIDENAPNQTNKPMADMSRSMYSIASGVAHGFTWTTNHLEGTESVFNVVADFLYAATTTTGAAVMLYEAQASATGAIGDKCPPHLRDAARQFHRRFAMTTV